MTAKRISRRTLLRGMMAGAAVAVPLPLLEAMFWRRGQALATEAVAPDRFGLWFWGNGTRPEHFVPSTTGSGWSPSAELSPLSGLVPYLSVVSGCEIKTATHPHHSGMSGILAGDVYYQLGTTRDTIVSTFNRQSVDQVAADHFSGQTPFRSLELGVTRFRGTDEGSTFEHLSHNGPNNVNPSEYDPRAVYNRLFSTPDDPRVDLARQSVLDAVVDQAIDLQRSLGYDDRLRVEQYLDSVRTLETQIAANVGACTAFDEPESYPDVNGQEQIEQKNLIMSQLIALALACDLTRAFSVQFSTCGSGVVVWQVGAANGLHTLCHEEAMPQDTVHAAITFTMGQLAVFLQTLADTPEGDGSLLDHCGILCTTELADGWTHSNQNYPILVAGKGNGRLRGGVHYRSVSLENTSIGVYTALRGAGVDVTSFGAGAGYANTVFSELLT
ncbi:MAG: DUF1552 domain-containing protein [Alphaproteobacteria bacterium]|nr:DUF1552 domain-containing protein [Alphaproteobacteria bacterium]